MKWSIKGWVWIAAFWISYLLLRLTVVQMYQGPFLFRLGVELIEIPLKMLALYATIHLLKGQLLIQHRYFTFLVAISLTLAAIMWLNRVEDYYFIYPLTGINYVRYENGFWSWSAAVYNLIYIYPVVGLGTAVYFARDWFENRVARERMAREQAQMELKLLKNQIHPHFLFNTLNNIYALALSQSTYTAEMILRLSELLSYMVYQGNKARVSLQKELQALIDYVELERLRLGDRLSFSFEAKGSFEHATIAPLILFPLVENCFKHGSHITTGSVWIRILLDVDSSGLSIEIENSVSNTKNTKQMEKGIGLANVKARLEHLYSSYQLSIQEGSTFLVHLRINENGKVSDS